MTWRLPPTLFVAGILLAGAGCVTECHHSAKAELLAGPHCEVPYCDRQHIYIVMVNGLTPELSTGLIGLRDKLASEGFAKVYYGQLFHAWWMEMEMKRIAKEDPSARFVVIGYDLGCPDALGMATAAFAKGVPVDGVLLFDPIAPPRITNAALPTTVLINGGSTLELDGCKVIVVPDAGHFTLPTNPQSVCVVLDLLKQSSARVIHPDVYDLPIDSSSFGPLPSDRLLQNRGELPEWSFLADIPENHPVPLTVGTGQIPRR